VRPSAAVESALYFACLEAMTNAIKHARAASVVVELFEPEAGQVGFAITDDGIGFEPASALGGTGLAGIGDRLGVLDGAMAVESAPGSGTTVRGWAYDADAERYTSTA
jgi:signal transduction histidine kinase